MPVAFKHVLRLGVCRLAAVGGWRPGPRPGRPGRLVFAAVQVALALLERRAGAGAARRRRRRRRGRASASCCARTCCCRRRCWPWAWRSPLERRRIAAAVVALGIGVGGVTGSQGITFAHELGHSRSRVDRALGWLLMGSVLLRALHGRALPRPPPARRHPRRPGERAPRREPVALPAAHAGRQPGQRLAARGAPAAPAAPRLAAQPAAVGHAGPGGRPGGAGALAFGPLRPAVLGRAGGLRGVPARDHQLHRALRPAARRARRPAGALRPAARVERRPLRHQRASSPTCSATATTTCTPGSPTRRWRRCPGRSCRPATPAACSWRRCRRCGSA